MNHFSKNDRTINYCSRRGRPLSQSHLFQRPFWPNSWKKKHMLLGRTRCSFIFFIVISVTFCNGTLRFYASNTFSVTNVRKFLMLCISEHISFSKKDVTVCVQLSIIVSFPLLMILVQVFLSRYVKRVDQVFFYFLLDTK